MREEKGSLVGDQVVNDDLDLFGRVVGNVRVVNGGKMYVRGTIFGNLTVERGGRVHIFGNVTGSVFVDKHAKVIHEGVIGADAVNRGGRLYIEAMGKVMGKLKPKAGDTQIDPHAEIQR